MKILTIDQQHPYYEQERELRNQVLLRPIGLPDYAWAMHDKTALHVVAIKEDKVIACVLLNLINHQEAQLMHEAFLNIQSFLNRKKRNVILI